MNFEGLELILQASLPVQIILAILCLASLLSWALIFEKFFSLQDQLSPHMNLKIDFGRVKNFLTCMSRSNKKR